MSLCDKCGGYGCDYCEQPCQQCEELRQKESILVDKCRELESKLNKLEKYIDYQDEQISELRKELIC